MSSIIYYARHVHDWKIQAADPARDAPPSVIEFLFTNRLVGVAFTDTDSWDPEDYRFRNSQGPSVIRLMAQCSDSSQSCYIFASYLIRGEHRVLVGRPKPYSKHLLAQDLGYKINKHIKVLSFDEDVRELAIGDFPFAFLLAPKQSTFVRWRQCEKVANAFLSGMIQQDLFDPDSYLPWAVEVLCEEYLRLRGILRFKLYKCGGTLKDFDIVGVNSLGERVLAQVKNKISVKQVKKFAEQCAALGAGNYFVFAAKKPGKWPYSNIHFVPLDDVLSVFRGQEDFLKKLMEATA